MLLGRRTWRVEGLDGWGWKDLKALPVSWYEGVAEFLRLVEEDGRWPQGLLDAYIATIPNPFGSEALVCSPRDVPSLGFCADGTPRGVPWFAVLGAEGVRGRRSSDEVCYATALDIEEVLSGDVFMFVADVVFSFDTVDRGVLDRCSE